MIPDEWDTAGTWALLIMGAAGLLCIIASWLRSRPARCPDCNAPKGTIHKAKCNYLVKQSGG